MNDSKMTYIVAVIGIVLLVGLWFWKNPMQPKVLTASGHPEWQPIMYQDGDLIVGAGPDLAKQIFADNGVEVKSVYAGPWDEVQLKAKSGEVDVLVAAYKTAERQEYMDYSDPYTTDPVALFVKKGSQLKFTTWDDLIGKKGVATVGDSYGQAFDDFIKAKLTTERVGTSKEAFEKVMSGKSDYFVYSLFAGNKEIKASQLQDKVVSLPQYVTQESFYITISKKSPFVKYMPQVNAGIAKYKADGTIDRLIADYQAK